LGSAGAWRFYEKRAQDKKDEDDFIKDDCAKRIDKLEALLEKSSEEKDEMRDKILELTKDLAELTIKVKYLEMENKRLLELNNQVLYKIQINLDYSIKKWYICMLIKEQEDMIARSLLIESKKLRIFDFDETLVKTNLHTFITHSNGKKSKLTPGQYAVYNEKPGDEFDFSDFQKVQDPKEIKSITKVLRRIMNSSGGNGVYI
jgi:hypothetical protein